MKQIPKVTPSNLPLRPYQRDGVIFLSKLRRGVLADDMGIGKTAQIIALLNIKQPKRVVIICPATVRFVWEDELNKWLTHKRSIVIVDSGKTKLEPFHDTVVISYNLTLQRKWYRQLADVLMRGKLDGSSWLILDESHYVTNIKAKVTLAVYRHLIPRCTRIYYMTGTPMKNRVTEMYLMFKCCAPKLFGSFTQFANKYSYKTFTDYGVVYRGLRNGPELKKLWSTFMIRRKKKDVLKSLPKKQYTTIPLPGDFPPLFTQEEMGQIQEDLREGTNKFNLYAKYARKRQELGIAKLPAVCAYIKTFLDGLGTESLIIGAYHKEVVHKITQFIISEGYQAKSLTGETSPQAKKDLVHSFQNGEFQVLVCNIIAAGTGITLHKASNLILAELDWVPANILQFIDRVHRIGQEFAVNIYFLIARNSIEDKLIKTIRTKLEITEEVLNGKRKKKK